MGALTQRLRNSESWRSRNDSMVWTLTQRWRRSSPCRHSIKCGWHTVLQDQTPVPFAAFFVSWVCRIDGDKLGLICSLLQPLVPWRDALGDVENTIDPLRSTQLEIQTAQGLKCSELTRSSHRQESPAVRCFAMSPAAA